MSRAFVFEKDGMFHCNIKDRDCPDANLRGGCDLIRCRHDDEMANAGEARHDEVNSDILDRRES